MFEKVIYNECYYFLAKNQKEGNFQYDLFLLFPLADDAYSF